VYTDHSLNIALITRDKFREWTEAWAKGFSDARITNPEYIDAGDIVIAQFTAERYQRRYIRRAEAHRPPYVSALL